MFDILVPCATGIEAVVKRQLVQLGYPELPAVNGRIRIPQCDWEDVAMLNIFLRSGERVLINVARFPSETFDELYDGVYSADWHNYLDDSSVINVVAKTVRSKLFAHHSVQGVAKKAIVTKLRDVLHRTVEENGNVTVVEIDITDNVAEVNIDTSGAGLHKRGYRTLAYSAPLKETTAAALIDLSYWHGDKVFTDLFCGSGTFVIEAAMIAANIAPGMNREFTAEKWTNFIEKKLWYDAVSDAEDEINTNIDTDIQGYDIDPEVVRTAKENAVRAGVEKLVHFQVRPVSELSHHGKYGFIITNPPYGERLEEAATLPAIYSDLGRQFALLDTWSAYMITSYEDAEKYIGRKADKNRKIYNGMIKTFYYQFLGPKPPKRNKTMGD